MAQPDPKPGKVEVLPLVLADLARIRAESVVDQNPSPELLDLIQDRLNERAETGLETYKVPLQTENGRDPLRDAFDEKLDDLMYLRQAIEEGDLMADPNHPVCEIYWHSFAIAVYLRLHIQQRDEAPTGCIPLPEGGTGE